MNEKIILFNPPAYSSTPLIRDFYCSFSSKTGYYWPPQDLLGLSGILRNHYEIVVIDAVANKLTPRECYDMIMAITAGALIFSTGMASFHEDMQLMAMIKKGKNIKIIGSSSIFRSAGEEMLHRHPFLDALITDFTDNSIIAYLQEDLRSGTDIIYREKTQAGVPKNNNQSDFSLGIPLYEAFINKNSRIPLFGNRPFSIVTASFGCTFHCSFCVVSSIKRKQRVVAEVIRDARHIRDLGIEKIFFVDPLFTAQKARTLQLCDGIKDLGLEWICNAHPSTLSDEDTLTGMKKAGCTAVMIGVESGNDAVLKRCAKGTTIEQIKKAFSLCRAFKIKTLAYFIVGLPGETKQSFYKTIELAQELRCDYASFGYAVPDIGTRLAQETTHKRGSFDPSLAPALASETLSEKDAITLLHAAYRKFYLRPEYILRRLAEVRSFADIELLLQHGGQLLKRNIL